MQLNKLMRWRQSELEQPVLDAVTNIGQQKEGEAVVKISLENPLDQPVGLVGFQYKNTPKGLLSSPAINQFFSQNFVNQGRYAGSSQKSRESLEQGLAGIIAQFQNTMFLVLGEAQAKIDSLRKVEIQSDGISETYSSQLKLACEKLERDVVSLRQQVDLSEQRKGWVLAALNEYRIGFDRGIREAIDAELLGL